MDSPTDISVLVTTYNQDESALAFTLSSIMRQDCDNIQVVVADDCSRVDPTPFVCHLFDAYEFTNYKIVRAKENLGTVANIAQGLDSISGRVVKPISPGDALFGSSTLSHILAFHEEGHFRIGFGGIVSYLPDGSFYPFDAPRELGLYQAAAQDSKAILRAHVLGTDWIPGACLFYEREFMQSYLHELSNRAQVRYCEDFAGTLCAADNIPIGYLGERVLWYEMGTGISTSGGNESVRRMYRDHRNFYRYLQDRIPDKKLASQAMRKFSLREFVALHTPFYRMAQRLKGNQYSGKSEFDVSGYPEETSFFWLCKNDADAYAC